MDALKNKNVLNSVFLFVVLRCSEDLLLSSKLIFKSIGNGKAGGFQV